MEKRCSVNLAYSFRVQIDEKMASPALITWRTGAVQMVGARVIAGFLLTLAATCLAQEHQHGTAERLGVVDFAT